MDLDTRPDASALPSQQEALGSNLLGNKHDPRTYTRKPLQPQVPLQPTAQGDQRRVATPPKGKPAAAFFSNKLESSLHESFSPISIPQRVCAVFPPRLRINIYESPMERTSPGKSIQGRTNQDPTTCQ